MNDEDSLWEDSFDTPCVHCGNTPCYTLVSGEAMCDRCWEGFNRLLDDMDKIMLLDALEKNEEDWLDRKRKNAGLA